MQDKYITYQNCPNNSNQDSYQEAIINVQNTYSEVIEEYYTEKVTQIKMPTAIINIGFARN